MKELYLQMLAKQPSRGQLPLAQLLGRPRDWQQQLQQLFASVGQEQQPQQSLMPQAGPTPAEEAWLQLVNGFALKWEAAIGLA